MNKKINLATIASFSKEALQGKKYKSTLNQVRDENTPPEKSESSDRQGKQDSLWNFLKEKKFQCLELNIFSSTPNSLINIHAFSFQSRHIEVAE